MILKIQEHNGIHVINIIGKLDVQSHLNLKQKFRDLVYYDEGRKVLVDVSGIQEIDSTGLGLFVSMLNTIRSRGGDLRLAGAFDPDVGNAFNLCGLSQVFKTYNNVEQGINNFND